MHRINGPSLFTAHGAGESQNIHMYIHHQRISSDLPSASPRGAISYFWRFPCYVVLARLCVPELLPGVVAWKLVPLAADSWIIWLHSLVYLTLIERQTYPSSSFGRLSLAFNLTKCYPEAGDYIWRKYPLIYIVAPVHKSQQYSSYQHTSRYRLLLPQCLGGWTWIFILEMRMMIHRAMGWRFG